MVVHVYMRMKRLSALYMLLAAVPAAYRTCNAYAKLCACIKACTLFQWGCSCLQVFILDSLAAYDTTDPRDAEKIVERVLPRLQHVNSAVVLSAIKVSSAHGPRTGAVQCDSSKPCSTPVREHCNSMLRAAAPCVLSRHVTGSVAGDHEADGDHWKR